MKTDPGRQGDTAALQKQIADLQAQIDQLKRQSLFGGKLQMRPDGTIKLGDVPATIEDDGIHFKDAAYGDGLFWDANTPRIAKLRGFSSATIAAAALQVENDAALVDYAELDLSASTSDVYVAVQLSAGGALEQPIVIRPANVRITRPLALTDGITAPGTLTGYAQIYVDTADGDLKVKFGNGFVATIALDS